MESSSFPKLVNHPQGCNGTIFFNRWIFRWTFVLFRKIIVEKLHIEMNKLIKKSPVEARLLHSLFERDRWSRNIADRRKPDNTHAFRGWGWGRSNKRLLVSPSIFPEQWGFCQGLGLPECSISGENRAGTLGNITQKDPQYTTSIFPLVKSAGIRQFVKSLYPIHFDSTCLILVDYETNINIFLLVHKKVCPVHDTSCPVAMTGRYKLLRVRETTSKLWPRTFCSAVEDSCCRRLVILERLCSNADTTWAYNK